MPSGFSRQSHGSAQLVQLYLRTVAKRREHVAEIDIVVGVPMEVGPVMHTGSKDIVDHGAVAQDGQVESGAVVGHHLSRQLSDLVNERFDELFLSRLADMWRPDSLDLITVGRPVREQRANADDRVINQLEKLVAHG